MKVQFLSNILSAVALIMGFNTMALANIDLTITYNNQAVCRYEITVKSGGTVIGKSTTNERGEVHFQAPDGVVDIDVFGYKKTANGEKKFDIQGYVKLDNEGKAHIKMEQLVKEMASDSGFPESLMASAWGLSDLDCGSTTGLQKGESKSEDANTPKESQGSEETDDSDSMSSETQALALQQEGLKNEIAMLDRKIAKGHEEMERMKVAAMDEREIKIQELDIEELKLKRERKKLMLEQNQKAQSSTLSEAQRKDYAQRESSYKSRERDLQDERKEMEAELKASKKEVKMSAQESSSGHSTSEELKREEGKIKVEIASVKTQIKIKESTLERALKKPDTPKGEIEEREAELLTLRGRLVELETRLQQLSE